MVNIKGFPLLHEEECKEMFSADMPFSGYYFMKPIYKWLPDFSELDDKEKEKYIFKNLKEGMYLVGLEIISEKMGKQRILRNAFRNLRTCIRRSKSNGKKRR